MRRVTTDYTNCLRVEGHHCEIGGIIMDARVSCLALQTGREPIKPKFRFHADRHPIHINTSRSLKQRKVNSPTRHTKRMESPSSRSLNLTASKTSEGLSLLEVFLHTCQTMNTEPLLKPKGEYGEYGWVMVWGCSHFSRMPHCLTTKFVGPWVFVAIDGNFRSA